MLPKILAGMVIFLIFCLMAVIYAAVCWLTNEVCPRCKSQWSRQVESAKFHESWKCARCRHEWDVYFLRKRQ
jgi:transposase-like protein